MSSITPTSTKPDSCGPTYWRSVEHLAGESRLQQYLESEFPGLASAADSADRREFLRLLGASMALAGLTCSGCRRWPVEEVRPHTSRPAGFLPGVAEHYATAFEIDGVATGLLAKSYDGRPIKIEGNPDHPFSAGAASAFAQASVLELYDPDRSRYVVQRGAREQRRRWGEFHAFASAHFGSLRQRKGAGLAVLFQPTSSPTWQRLRGECERVMPESRWFAYQPLHHDHELAGSRAAFGRALRPQYDLRRARVIVSFAADLLGSHPAHLKLARDWAAGRHSVDVGQMNRMYVFESGMSLTGSVADVRRSLKPSLIEASVAYAAHLLGILSRPPTGLDEETVTAVTNAVRDLSQAGSSGIVIAGPEQSAETHRLVHAINEQIGAVGQTVNYSEESLATPVGNVDRIAQLSELLQGNVLDTLVIVGGNPLYDAPRDTPLNLKSSDARPLTSIHLSLYDNETSQACSWHLNAAHYLECWGDGRAWDGTYTLQQPLIRPLFDGRSGIELLALLLGQSELSSRSLVRQTFDQQMEGTNQQDWEQALHDGVVQNSAHARVNPSRADVDSNYEPEPSAGNWEVRFTGDAKTFDGRFANNGWLQELPDPLTKLTWDNAALISQADAAELDVETGDVVRIRSGESEDAIEIPVFVMPGHASGCITLPLGYGRTRAGRVGNDVGVSAYRLRRRKTSYLAADCRVSKTGRRHELVSTQVRHSLDPVAEYAKTKRLGEPGAPGMIVHETLFAEYQRDPHAAHGEGHAVHEMPLFDLPNGFDTPHKWGMSIDLNACIGCSGCVVACQAENNIPVVGKANVAVNREMHWLRIDRYFKGEAAQPDVVHLPMACAHCENAPCEQVCPVAATLHDTEGLNAMVYNRCIGTRYCSNNCPYKVRRFNYFDYHAADPRTPAKPWFGMPDEQQSEGISPLKQMVHNPEVSVRMRGVMEKCTYCVQRIVAARIEAKNEHAQGLRESDLVADGELQTACQATCPTNAIVFGDLNDPESAVSNARASKRSYEILEELNLGARTTYLAKVRNRDPES